MADNYYLNFWQHFISELIRVRDDKPIVKDEMKNLRSVVQFSLACLGWVLGRNIFRRNLLNDGIEKPDYLLKIGDVSVPVKVKQPSSIMNEADIEQLNEYMCLSDSNIGIYIGEHVRVFYRPSIEDELKIVVDADLTENDIEGELFAALFFYPHFDTEFLRSTLDILYRLERVIDDFKVTKIVSKEWIKDRYRKRALL